MTADDLGEAWAFIRTTIDTQTGSRWQQNELVTICDGSSCVTLSFQALPCACWLPLGPTYRDNGKGYKNAQTDKNPPKASNGADGTYAFTYWRIFLSSWEFTTGTPHLVTPIVEVHQSSDLSSASFGTDFGAGFDLGSTNSSYAFDSDFAYGGQDAEYGSGTMSSGGGGCHVDCPPIDMK